MENGYVLPHFDTLRVAIRMAGKEKRIRERREEEERKMTRTSFLTGTSLVDG